VSRAGLLANFLTFGAVGAIGTAVHYAALVALVEGGGIAPTLATVAGAILGALANYILNYRITFRSSADHRVALLRFGCVAALGVAVSAALVATAQHFGLPYLLGQIAATLVVLLLGYELNRRWTFREATDADH
jgi:putative flippase GtrA